MTTGMGVDPSCITSFTTVMFPVLLEPNDSVAAAVLLPVIVDGLPDDPSVSVTPAPRLFAIVRPVVDVRVIGPVNVTARVVSPVAVELETVKPESIDIGLAMVRSPPI